MIIGAALHTDLYWGACLTRCLTLAAGIPDPPWTGLHLRLSWSGYLTTPFVKRSDSGCCAICRKCRIPWKWELFFFKSWLLCLFRQFTTDNRAKKCAIRPFWMADRLSHNLMCTEKEGTRFPQPRFFSCRILSFYILPRTYRKHLRTHHSKSAVDYTATDSDPAAQSGWDIPCFLEMP